LAIVAFLLLAGTAFGASDHRVVKVQDDCEQVSFDAAVGPGTCIGDGDTLFPDFLAEFQDEGSVDGWAFSRDDFGLEHGGTIDAVNEGGEFHTFTEVPRFGNGCVPLLNQGDDPAVVDCAFLATTGVPPGTTLTVGGLAPGEHKFMCLIHPWMQSTAKVEGDDDEDHSGQG